MERDVVLMILFGEKGKNSFMEDHMTGYMDFIILKVQIFVPFVIW